MRKWLQLQPSRRAPNPHRNPRRRLHEKPRPRERSCEVGARFGEVFSPFGVEVDHVVNAQNAGGFCGIR
ncbi:hypothetical protein GCM10009655_14650 [Rhodoglobus aureus]|uniref:Uncharacterized protein n=1 Tax=Rhodoglobus aureus TaxID=191497 RepID=A0ABP4G7C7_9MICO